MAVEAHPHDRADVLLVGVGRVLGVDSATLRHDTPLALLGWDSLARVCLIDIIAADRESAVDVTALDRWLSDAATIGDLVAARDRVLAINGAS